MKSLRTKYCVETDSPSQEISTLPSSGLYLIIMQKLFYHLQCCYSDTISRDVPFSAGKDFPLTMQLCGCTSIRVIMIKMVFNRPH